MRALCGAIITAASIIGLGITALAFGHRYSSGPRTPEGQPVHIHLDQMDGPLQFVLVFLSCLTIIGLGLTFLGLAYHHHRREREHLLHRAQAGVR
jgi:hypothetical protein